MKSLEEIVTEHPLPWHLQEDAYYTPGMDLIPIPPEWHYPIAEAAPAMALAIRALLRDYPSTMSTMGDAARALRASLPPELRP